jgi:hypothetical protein
MARAQMQPREQPLGRAQHVDGAGAFGIETVEGAGKTLDLAQRGRHRGVVGLDLGGFADHGACLIDVDLRARAGMDRELRQFAARGGPVAAQTFGQPRQRRLARAHPFLLQGRADHRGQIAPLVGIAGQRRRVRRPLEKLAQRRA